MHFHAVLDGDVAVAGVGSPHLNDAILDVLGYVHHTL